jgi:hypothetical protein
MADGGAARRLDPALDLLASQQRDLRAQTGDTPIRGSSLIERGEAPATSVLEAGRQPRSYTESQTPDVGSPFAGGGLMETPAMELERVRAEEERMRRTQEQFVGAPTVPTVGPQMPPSREAQPQGPAAEEVPSEEEEAEEEEGLDIGAAQAQERREEERSRQIAQLQARQQAEQIRKEVHKKMLDQLKMANGGLSVETLAITLLINLALWNIQGINKYFFKSDIIPDQSFPEDMACATLDFAVIFGSIPCILGPLFILIGAATVVAQKIGVIGGA